MSYMSLIRLRAEREAGSLKKVAALNIANIFSFALFPKLGKGCHKALLSAQCYFIFQLDFLEQKCI